MIAMLFLALISIFAPVEQRGFECQRYVFDSGQWRCADHLASPNWVDLNDEVGGGPGLGFPGGQPFGLTNAASTTSQQRAIREVTTITYETCYYCGATWRGAKATESAFRRLGYYTERFVDAQGRKWVRGTRTVSQYR